jgi:hypothetical protein
MIGDLISIKFTDRKSPIYGFVIDYNNDWTLMKYNVVDYEIDGYIIFRHKNIEGYRKSEDEKFREKVLTLKKLGLKRNEKIPITDLQSILSYLMKKYGVFGLYTKSESAFYIGRLKSLDSRYLVIDFLDPKGKWKGKMKFRPGDIRTIQFDSDYINSLKLVADNSKKKR